jgi:hypothetical protein
MRFVPVIALLALSTAAYAQEATPSPAPTPAPVKEKQVCRNMAVTGSIMGRRICHTAAEWRQIDGSNSDAAGRALDASRTRNNGMGLGRN